MNINITNQRLAQAFSGLVLVAISICFLLAWKTRQSTESYLVAKAQYSSTQDSIFQHLENTDYLRANLPDFSRYKSQGKIGAFDRIVWVDALEKIGDNMKLPEFHYEMSPSKLVANPRLQHAELHVVNITLRIGFSHDGEIFEYFTALSDRISAIYEIAEFDVVRVKSVHTEGEEGKRVSALKVVCRINWYSITVLSENVQVDV